MSYYKKYGQMDLTDRIAIETGLSLGESFAKIAKRIGRHPSSVSHEVRFANYISTIFMFILLSNISGLLGLRPPTADYGVTFPMGVITFCLIFFNKLKHQKLSGFIKGLCDPWPIWAPINIVGDVAVPISLSLRLFANVLSGTVMMALYYGLLPIFVKIGIPSALHVYFDLFSGAIQTYVFCMLTMTYITDAIGDN